MKKIITGLALLLITTVSAFSQTKNITVSGRVVEDTKEPAAQATVQYSHYRTVRTQPVLLLPGKAILPYRR